VIQETLTKEVTLAVVGSRRWKDKALLFDVLDDWMKVIGKPDLVVSGGADGADILGETWAKSRGIKTDIKYPEWRKEGFMAGINRNADIVSPATHMVAFFLPFSGGTMNSLKRAMGQHLHITIVDHAPWEEIHDDHCCACWAMIQAGDARIQMNRHIFTPNCFERHTNEGCMMGARGEP